MQVFSPTDAALEGFRVTRENPRAFVRWVLFSFVISLLGAIITVSMPADVRNALDTLRADKTPDTRELLEALLATGPLLWFGLMVQCVMAAAVYRIILRHDDARFGYLRLGLDEIRLMALTLVMLCVVIGLMMAVTMASVLIGGLAFGAGHGVGMAVGAMLELLSLGLIIYVMVRLSLAPVVTFAERRLVLFGAWSLTEGLFWRLLGAYLLAVFTMFLVTLLTLILFITLTFIYQVATGGSPSEVLALLNPDETSYGSYFNVTMILYMFVGSIVTALWWAVIAAPGAWVYHEHALPRRTAAVAQHP
jgi:hypothetical protein